ncbi:glycosyltransferase [Candidatus Daviesbacteria bacterium]|nr:glycosyltransferase [Candidatus Daviesbacteria bacterium]
MKVAIVHDDIVQWGGAERILLGLCEIYPEASIFTSVYDYTNEELRKRFGNKRIITSFLQKIPGWRNLYKILLPLYPLAFESFNFDQFDLVISHTTRFAKSIITKPETKHVCFCHTPPRFLWHFSDAINYGFGELLLTKLRLYDQISSRRVDYFLAGSKNAEKRIKKIYHQDSKLIYPFIDLDRFNSIESFDGGYFLVISRLNKYKRIDLAVKACLSLGSSLKIIGVGPQLDRLIDLGGVKGVRGVEFLGNLSDQMVINVLAGCKALIIAGIEDFGITSIEAQALGKPVIAYGYGGVLETVIEGKTGIFFYKQTVESLMSAIKRIDSVRINGEDCKTNAKKFSKKLFFSNFKQAITSSIT